MNSSVKTAPVNMMLGQLYTNEIADQRLLDAIIATPREKFVPPQFAKSAYVDAPLPYGDGRFMLEPLVAAKMLQLADLSSNNNVLVIGSGLGYLLAVASALAATVVGIESDAALANSARVLLQPYAPKVRVEHVKNLVEGYENHAPYDVIIIEGAVEKMPEKLKSQLNANGKIIAIEPINNYSAGTCGGGKLVVYTLSAHGTLKNEYGNCASPVLPGFSERKKFLL